MVKLLIIDGFNFIRRIHSAIPGDENAPEHAQGVLRSITASLQRALDFHQPTHAVCVLESSGHTWRHAIYSDYKLGRKPQPPALMDNLEHIKQALTQMQVAQIAMDQVEGDDLIASIATKLDHHHGQNLILSTDHLLAQLLSAHIRQHDHFAKRDIDAPFIHNRYGVTPAQLVDYFALCGSSSMHIPGIKGVGPKTAIKLLDRFGTLEELIAQAKTLNGKLGQQVTQGADLLPLYKRLFTLERKLSLDANLNQWRITQ